MIAVTAASGRLGTAVLRHLAAAPGRPPLRAVVRSPDRFRLPGIDVRAGDYTDVAQMTAALAGVRTVVMISAPLIDGLDRLPLHRNVIAAAKAAGVHRVVYTGVIGTDGPAGTLFEPSQTLNRQTEAALAASGLDWVIARNGLYLELDLGHIRRANETGVYRNNAGEGRCGYLSIDELAYAIARLALNEAAAGRRYNLVGENLSQAELVALANEVFGLDVRYEAQTTEENIARFMADPRMAARGEAVLKMLTGCFQCIARGIFDVPSDYAAAAGRPPRSVREQMMALRDGEG